MLFRSAQFPHALRRLSEAFPKIKWHQSESGQTISLSEDKALPEGAFRIEATPERVTISGGPFSGVIYGVEELIKRGGDQPDLLSVSADTIYEVPGLTYRTFWTWDHSTNWELSQIGQQEIGVFNPYQKPPSGFLSDYKRCVDFCSRNRIAAIVIYGFLRDPHGGIEAAKELCRYAAERGVRTNDAGSRAVVTVVGDGRAVSRGAGRGRGAEQSLHRSLREQVDVAGTGQAAAEYTERSEEHTSELQSH